MARSGTGGTATLDFSDGDTLKRFTITDVNVQLGAAIIPSVQRSGALQDQDDPGWVYVVNVVNVANGSFDVLVAAFAGEGVAAAGETPSESILLTYLID